MNMRIGEAKLDTKMTTSNELHGKIPDVAEMRNLDGIAVTVCKLCQTSFNTI
jgi:hypothetical protein